MELFGLPDKDDRAEEAEALRRQLEEDLKTWSRDDDLPTDGGEGVREPVDLDPRADSGGAALALPEAEQPED